MIDIRNNFCKELPKNRIDYTAGGSTLVVSFDNAGAPHREPKDRLAWGHRFFSGEGHSVLGVIAHESDWYRCPTLHHALLDLKEKKFFSSFDNVVLTGSSMGGFAATAFASLSPGCRVISYNPQSTLKNALVPWETDHPNGRTQSWDGLFFDGAIEVAAAEIAYVIYDPYHSADRRHAERYTSPNVQFMHAPFLGHGLPDSFNQMGMLKDVMRRGIAGDISNDWYYQAIRARRNLLVYHKALAVPLAKHEHIQAGVSLMARAYEKFEDPWFGFRQAAFQAGSGDMMGAMNILAKIDRKRRASKRRRR